MKLYTDLKGNWAGTQSDARKIFGGKEGFGWVCVDVPTAKPELLPFLDHHFVMKCNEPKLSSTENTIDFKAESYFAWALDTLNRGDAAEAKEFLVKGLSIHRETLK